MKKFLYTLFVLLFAAVYASCSDTQTYADLVNNEENSINYLVTTENMNVISINEETMENWTDYVLKDSISPAEYIQLGQWYTVTEGYFKRLYFRINDWGTGFHRWQAWKAYNDSIADHLSPSVKPDSVSFYDNKIVNGSYVLVRYDSLFLMTDSLDIHSDTPADNLNPYSYKIIFGWNPAYYATTYYSYSMGSSSSYACTSGGLAFPLRYLWYDSSVSLIVPFSITESEYSSYYYTFYYGNVKYSKPNYLPEE